MDAKFKLNYNSPSSVETAPSGCGAPKTSPPIRSSREDEYDSDDEGRDRGGRGSGRGSGHKIENFSNIELPHTIFYVGTPPKAAGAAAAAADATKKTVVEGFDQGSLEKGAKDPKQAMKDLKKIAMAPVAFMMNLNPVGITDNPNIDAFITYLAGPSIVNRVFYTTSAELLSQQEYIGTSETTETKNISWIDYLRQKFDIDNLKDTQKANDEYQKQNEELKRSMEDAKEGRSTKREPVQPRRTGNAELDADRVIVKDYMFKTIILMFSFFTVYNWAYFFMGFSGLGALPEKPCDKYTERWTDGIPIIGYIAKILRDNISPTFRAYNPFFLTEKIFAGITDAVKYVCDKDIKKAFNKEVWFLLIFAFTFFSGLYFIGKYNDYMADIRNMRQNPMIIFFYICCIYLYLESFISDFDIMKKITIASGGLFTLIYYFIKNIVILFLIATNPYIALFFFIMFYLFITFAGIVVYPSFSFSEVPKRYTQLVTEIKQSYEADVSDDSLLWVFIRSMVHFIYSNMTISILGVWFIYLFVILNKQLKYASLRENINTLLGISMFLMISISILFKMYTASAADTAGGSGAAAAVATTTAAK